MRRIFLFRIDAIERCETSLKRLSRSGVCEGSSYGQQYGVGKQNNDGTPKCDVYPIPAGQNYECQVSYCPGSGSW